MGIIESHYNKVYYNTTLRIAMPTRYSYLVGVVDLWRGSLTKGKTHPTLTGELLHIARGHCKHYDRIWEKWVCYKGRTLHNYTYTSEFEIWMLLQLNHGTDTEGSSNWWLLHRHLMHCRYSSRQHMALSMTIRRSVWQPFHSMARVRFITGTAETKSAAAYACCSRSNLHNVP